MAIEWIQYGIRVNSISPGYIETPPPGTLAAPQWQRDDWNRLIPMGRMGKPEELMPALLYLASGASSYTTGCDLIVDGRVLIAAGGKQFEVVRSGTGWKAKVFDGPLCCGHRPSVEVMMNSVAKNVGRRAVGAMLTGMGADGANGMKAMRDAGARCIAQDEATCVVFGMPKEAYERGGAEQLVPLPKIAATLQNLLR